MELYVVIIVERQGTFGVIGAYTDQFFAYKMALKKEYEYNKTTKLNMSEFNYEEIDKINSIKYFESFIDNWLKLRTRLDADFRFVVCTTQLSNCKMKIEESVELMEVEEVEEVKDTEEMFEDYELDFEL